MSLKGGLWWLPTLFGLSEKGREGIGRSRSSLEARSRDNRRNQEDMIEKKEGKRREGENNGQEMSI